MVGEQSHHIATPVVTAHPAATVSYDDLGRGLVVVLVALLTLVALLVIVFKACSSSDHVKR